jgi:mannosyltransferase
VTDRDPRDSRVARLAPWVGGALSAVVSWLGSWSPSYWGDEAASVLSATRPLGSLFGELGRVDAVHGVYYLFLHGWIRIFGASELSTRAPSALAVGLAVAGIIVLAMRFTGVGVAVLAGAVCAVLPRMTWAATEARSYALASAAGVWLTVALIAVIRKGGARRGGWIRYALALGAAPYLFLFLGLLVPVHGLFLALARAGRAVLVRWLSALVVAAALAAPIVVLASDQRGQVAFLARRHYLTPEDVLVAQWFGTTATAAVCWTLILCGVVAAGAGRSGARRGERHLTVLALLWLVLPTALVILESAGGTAVYNMRYLSLSTPAAALLVGLGVAAVARWSAAGVRALRIAERAVGWSRRAIALLLLALVVTASTPPYLAERGPYGKDGGSDWRQLSSYLGATARPGDAVVFDETTKPSQDPRLALRLYPEGFRGLEDVELRRAYDRRPWLWDDVRPLAETYGRLTPTVWAVELPRSVAEPVDVSALAARGYAVASVHRVHRVVVYRMTRAE